MNYTTSINRPGISYLNPAVVISPTIIYQGNPQLVSSRTQRISVIYSCILPNLTLQVAPGYHHTSDGISDIQTNNLRYEHYENPNLGYRTFGWSDNYYVNLSQKLPWKLLLYLSSYGKIGRSPSDVYTMRHSYFGYYASLQRSFLKADRLTVRIAANAPFNKYWSSETETVNGNYHDFQQSWNRAKASVKKTEHSIDNDDVVGGISKGSK